MLDDKSFIDVDSLNRFWLNAKNYINNKIPDSLNINRPNTDGMGYLILDKNKSFKEQVTQENTIYEIRYDFDLGGLPVPIPKGCTLKFEGGSLGNGTIKISNTASYNYDTLVIESGPYHIFKDGLNIEGVFTSDKISIEWFGAIGDGKTDCTEAFRKAVKMNSYINSTDNTLSGHGYNIYLNSKRTYIVRGSINYYDDKYHDVKNIAFIGDKRTSSEAYPAYESRPCMIYLDTNNTSLFKGAECSNITFQYIYIGGKWINWVESNVKFFDDCLIHTLNFKDNVVAYIYAMFYDTGVWGVTRIHNNRFLGVYNFSKMVDAEGQKLQFVDSVICDNYINGGVPGLDQNNNPKVVDVDSVFFSWTTANGAEIHHNFIDYYRSMYDCNMSYGNINSNHNHYQVFKYFHTNCEILSVNDYFNWNDPEASSIKSVMDNYKDMTVNGKIVPPYIATDIYCNHNAVFKDMVIEENIKNIVLRVGHSGGVTKPGIKFIVELHEHALDRTDSIVYFNWRGAPNESFPVYLGTFTNYEVSIDRRLAHKLDALPTNTELFSGAWGKYAMGDWIKVGAFYYKFCYVAYTENGTGYYELRRITNNMQIYDQVSPEYETVKYVYNNTFDVTSPFIHIWSTDNASQGRDVVNSINIYYTLIGRVITATITGNPTFNCFKDKFGNPLKLKTGDTISFIKRKNGSVVLISYNTLEDVGNFNKFIVPNCDSTRPDGTKIGENCFDTSLGKPIWWNGTAWVDSTGTVVS